ncbi:hypothetical protein [Parapedobacter lycopersici]|uniref:hypothetical protein n=1 Tax=Parapedobacter lycopersici TaxID=1864939 RepID=UPI00214D845A|nr:hypothetical protein [Parapedobacter lycopersici]
MKNNRKTIIIALLALGTLGINACSKDDPQPEIPQEEVNGAKLTFVEVTGENGEVVTGVEPIEITFDDKGLPPVGAHAHVEEGKTYRLTLTAYDFANREMQQEFLNDADRHQVFILGAPDGVLDYVYADPDNARVGVTGYIHVLKASDGFTFNFIVRHLNEGVKAGITAADWNNTGYNRFGGANDLDLKFELHPVVAGHGDDH